MSDTSKLIDLIETFESMEDLGYAYLELEEENIKLQNKYDSLYGRIFDLKQNLENLEKYL